MPFVVRVQCATGLKRIELMSVTSAWAELQAKIAAKFGIAPEHQKLSRTRLHQPDFIAVPSPETPVGALGLEHGSMLFLEAPPPLGAAGADHQQPAFRLTDRCAHAAKGRCMHCSPAAADEPIAEWLCTHPASAFCPKCLPPPSPQAGGSGSGSSGGGLAREQDVASGGAYKVDVMPYAHMMAEKKALCGVKHADTMVCHRCAPPTAIDYRGKQRCDNGHRPWPQGICGRCAPPNAVLALQKFRHCDGVSFKNVVAGERFISEWSRNPALQRAALLFGRYIDEPTASKFQGAIRAEVEGVYEPPQEPLPDGVKLLRDPNMEQVMAVAAALGLECVGWAITTLPRGGDEFGGDILLSGAELMQAANFQSRFADQLGHSRFITMVIQYNAQGHIEPRAYQISDQGVAMQRAGLICAGSKAGFIQPRKPKPGEFMPSIVYKNNALKAGADFLPDELLVKVVAMKPYKPKPMFKYVEFPLAAGEHHFRQYLAKHAGDPYHEKFSDFGVLMYLPKVVGLELATAVARAVKHRQELDLHTQQRLDTCLLKYM